jgi:hypothetical protein
MMLSLHTPIVPDVSRSDLIRAALAGMLLLALCALLASTYVGHAPGPYGACYVKSGRQVPCELVSRRR